MIDFSDIKDKEKDELVLWKDYLIYSVILGINNEITDKAHAKL